MTLGEVKVEIDKLDKKAIALYSEYIKVRELAKKLKVMYEAELLAARARYNSLPRIKRNSNPQ